MTAVLSNTVVSAKKGKKMEYESKRRMILYGPPASGKTESLASVPGSLHVVDFDRQLKSLIVKWKKRRRPMTNLSWASIDTTGTPREAFEQARDALFHPPDGFEFYALDSYTTFGLIATHYCVGVGERKYNMQTSTNMMAYITDYFWQFANDIERMGAWLIVIMHEKWIQVDDGTQAKSDWKNKKEMICPEVASSARVTVPANCDFVFHIEKAAKAFRGVVHSESVFRTTGTPFIMAKAVGYGDVLEEVEDADIGEILKTIKLPPKVKTKSSQRKTTTRSKEKKSRWQK